MGFSHLGVLSPIRPLRWSVACTLDTCLWVLGLLYQHCIICAWVDRYRDWDTDHDLCVLSYHSSAAWRHYCQPVLVDQPLMQNIIIIQARTQLEINNASEIEKRSYVCLLLALICSFRHGATGVCHPIRSCASASWCLHSLRYLHRQVWNADPVSSIPLHVWVEAHLFLYYRYNFLSSIKSTLQNKKYYYLGALGMYIDQ